jgi:hypothetical protein
MSQAFFILPFHRLGICTCHLSARQNLWVDTSYYGLLAWKRAVQNPVQSYIDPHIYHWPPLATGHVGFFQFEDAWNPRRGAVCTHTIATITRTHLWHTVSLYIGPAQYNRTCIKILNASVSSYLCGDVQTIKWLTCPAAGRPGAWTSYNPSSWWPDFSTM